MADPFVLNVGACTPVGRTALASAAAVRAGITGFSEHPFMSDRAGQPVRVALAPWINLDCDDVERFVLLLVPAIEQALAALTDVRIGLAVALPEPRPGLPSGLEDALRAEVLRAFPGRFASAALISRGHAAGFIGLEAAWRKIGDGGLDACVVAGVESYAALETLEWLDAQEQLHGAGALNNPWGFIPGEGAGAMLLGNEVTAARLGLPPLGHVRSVGTAREANRIKTETVCIGEGLTAAFRAALRGLPPGALITDMVCDMNGEPYRADEFGFACLRTRPHFVSASEFVAPADCWGDVSAASAPLAVVLAAIAGSKGYAHGEYALLWASSEGGDRGAALVQTLRARG